MSAREQDAGLELRRLEPDDLERILEIERACYSLPWSRAMFVGELRKATGLRIGADVDGLLCGYVICGTYAGVWHVMNVAVAPEWRRQGIAEALLEQLWDRTADVDARGYTLEVRASNVAAQRLYERFGFRPFGLRRGYYVDDHEDAIVMWKPPQGVSDPDAWAPEI